MSDLKDFVIEWGDFFRTRETLEQSAVSESALEAELMRTRPEIFPVHIVEVKTQEELDGQVLEVTPCAA